MDQIPTSTPSSSTSKRSLWRPFAVGAIAVAAIAGSLGAVSVAGAQSDETPETSVVEPTDAAESEVQLDGDASDADEALFDQFDQCLTNNGLTEELDEKDEWTAEEETAIEAAFETCEPILDNLSEDFADFEDSDISPEDEALFDQFDQCLTNNGLTEELDEKDEWTAEEETAIEAAFETCEPILDNLSEDFADFEDCDDDEEHADEDADDEEELAVA